MDAAGICPERMPYSNCRQHQRGRAHFFSIFSTMNPISISPSRSEKCLRNSVTQGWVRKHLLRFLVMELVTAVLVAL
jgi:hypothetical protein